MHLLTRYAPLASVGLLFLASGCASVTRPSPSSFPYSGPDAVDVVYPDMDVDAVRGTDREAPVTLDAYLDEAFRRNPGLRASFDRWQAAMERIPQARALDDPTLSFEYFVDQMDARYQVSLTQMFPALGVLRLRRDRAAAEALAAMHTFEAERFDLYERVVRGFHEYHYLARATAIADENLRLLGELEQAVEARYRAGDTAFADLIKVRIESERLADRLATLRDQRRARSVGLAALLNRPADDLLPWPEFQASGSVTIDETALAEILADLNPDLKAAAARVEAAELSEGLARRSGWPRVMLGAGYMVMPGMDGRGDETDIGLMTGVTLPVWRGRVRAAREEAAAQRRAAEHSHDNLRNRLRSELSMAVFQFNDAERRIALFAESLLPKAEQALDVARQAYADGQAGFMTLIDAQRMLLEFQLLAERADADREIALADIRCCVGADLFNASDPTDPTDRTDNRETLP